MPSSSWCITVKFCLQVLQSHTDLLTSGHLPEELEKLHVLYMHANSRQKNGSNADPSSTDGFAADIESEANSYFQQMFSGQLTIDAMIQMLARFKESPEKRSSLLSGVFFRMLNCYLFIYFCVGSHVDLPNEDGI